MQILLDECLPRDFRQFLLPHQVSTVPEKRWNGIANGKLLALAQKNGFQVFITIDQNLAVQNPTAGKHLIVIVLRSQSNRLPDIQPFAHEVCSLLATSPIPNVYYLEP